MEITIIGGGITGLTTGLALKKLDIPFKIFERSSGLNEVGAGIWMAPNAIKVFDWLGIGNEVRNGGSQLQSVEMTNKDLKPVRNSRAGFIEDSKGNTITSIHRAKLQRILYNNLPEERVFLGSKYLDHTDEGEKIGVRFSNGKASEAEAILGADGIHSQVRSNLFNSYEIRYSGQTCWRGISQIKLPKEYLNSCREAWGKGIRFGFSVIGKNSVYWFSVKKAPRGQKDDPGKLKDYLLNLYRDFHPLIKEILHNTPEEKIIRNDLSDLKPMDAWHKGKVCLLGDAAHATTPNMGQGGAQGVEDAYYVSNLIHRAGNINEAFRKFESLRRKKVNDVVNTSKMIGAMAHNPVGQVLFKITNTLTPDSLIKKQLQKLYHIKDAAEF